MRGASTSNTPFVSEEKLSSETDRLNSLVTQYNDSAARFIRAVNSRSSYTNSSPVPEEYTTTLTHSDANSEIRLANGPYSDLGGVLEVGSSRIPIPPATAYARTFRPYEDKALSGQLKVQILTYDSLEEFVIELGTPTEVEEQVTVKVWNEEEGVFEDREIVITVEKPAVLTLAEIESKLSAELFGVASVYTDAEGYITIEGDPGVYCLRVYGNLASSLGFPSKMGNLSSGEFVPTQYIAELVGGSVRNLVKHTGEINVQDGVLTYPQISAKSILRIPQGSYVVDEGGRLTPYLTLTPVTSLSGAYIGQVSEERVTILNMKGGVTSSTELGAYKIINSDRCKLTTGWEGDFIQTKGGLVEIISLAQGNAKIARPLPSGDYSVASPEYLRSKDLATKLKSINYLAKVPKDYYEALSMAKSLASLRSEIATDLNDRPTSLKRQLSNALSKIRASHLNLGLDRAWDILKEGDLELYFSLSEPNASYASMIRSSLNKIAPRVRSL